MKRSKTVIEAMQRLPYLVTVDVANIIYEFEFRVIQNGNQVRLVYALVNGGKFGSWINKYRKGGSKLCSFLLLYEKIESDEQLIDVLDEAYDFLLVNKLL